ncbi:MAG: hypothetical protein JWQ35_455 [Bacteriovoracaceae bacterium]|nr:hypothetical protein [Bacteriovoracaceae bacterium]
MADRKIAPLFVLVFSVILILLLGFYYNEPFVIGSGFHSLRFVLYLVFPILLNIFYFKISWRELGVAKPYLNRTSKRMLFGFAILTPFVVYLIHLSPDYLNAYPYYRNQSVSTFERLSQFSIFTFSTMVGWEFLLRAYLLFGMRRLLENQHRVSSELATALSILWVCTFEVLYHFVKPDLEAWGMLIASPILSWIAFKTRSFFVPLAFHLFIETSFIISIIYF